MQTCLIFNPVARGGKAKNLRRHLDALGSQCTLQPTDGPGRARFLAAQAARAGFQTIVAAGGDGTVNEVLNGIGDVPQAFDHTRLAVLPMGTINVFARELGLPLRFQDAWKTIQHGKEIRIDLPLAQYTVEGKPQQRYFIQLAGAGLDSRAIELVNWELKKKIGSLAYVVAGLKAIREPHPPITVEAQGAGRSATLTTIGELVLLGNGRYYGGNFVFFPKASLQNGRIEACIFPKVHWSYALRIARGLLTGKLPQLCGASELSASSVKLTSPSHVMFELDGENVGELPVEISVCSKKLRIVVP